MVGVDPQLDPACRFTAMAMCPGDTTQWHDIQVKFGNFEPIKREPDETRKGRNELQKIAVDAAERFDPLENRTLGELDKLEDEIEEDYLAKYRKQRMEELKMAQSKAKFGSIKPVDKKSFVTEVTEGSADGQWVLVIMHQEWCAKSQLLLECFKEAAKRFPKVKFMHGKATEIIENFPDHSIPTVLVYKDQDCAKQLVGAAEWGGANTTSESVEWVLANLGCVETDLEEDPRLKAAPVVSSGLRSSYKRRTAADSDSEDDDEDRFTGDRSYSAFSLGSSIRRI